MKAEWYRYEIDLGGTVRLGPAEARIRRGCILRLEDEAGRVGVGDAAPIDGYGRDTESEVLAALTNAALTLGAGSVPADRDGLQAWSHSNADAWPPTIRYAAESALMELSAQAAGVSPGEWLGGVARPTIAVCGLPAPRRTPDSEPFLDAASGSVIKLKVGQGDPAAEGRSVAAGLARIPDVRIRCDANRAWSPEGARAFIQAFQDAGGEMHRFEFLEEPLRDPTDIAGFASDSPVPIALDETILRAGPSFDPHAWKDVDYFVLKPALFGGLTESCAFVRRVRESGGQVVASSAYESGVGLLTAAWFASTFDGPAVGFGTAARVACADIPVAGALLEHPIAVVNLPANPGSGVRFGSLEAINE